MKKRKLKLFSLIMSLILVLVSVPTVAFSEEISSDDISEEITTEFQSDLSITEQMSDITLQEPIEQMATTSASDAQLVTGIPDGIYAIEIATLSTYYILFSQSSTDVSCNPIMVSPTAMGMTAYLFSVTRVPYTDRYIIRSVADQTKTFKTFSSSVVWETIPTDDIQVSESNTFNIIDNNGVYLIKEVGTGKYICGGSGSTLAATNSLSTQVLTSWRFRGYRSYIEDGVYSFKNVGNTGLWMDTQHDSYLSGKHAQQFAYESCPIDDMSRGGMFKISRIGDTDQYVIRLMTNNLLAWGVEGTYILSQSVGIDDTQIPDSAKFHIAYDNGNYIIIPYGTMTAITATPNSTASGSSGGTEAYLSTTLQYSMTNSARWNLYKYSGSMQFGVGIIAPSEMEDTGAEVGKTYTVNPVVWTTSPWFHNSIISLSTGCNTNAVIFDWDPDNQKATMEITNPGYLSLSVQLVLESDGNVSILCSEQYEYNAIPKVGTYYIQNSETEKYVTIEHPSYEEGISVEQSEFSTANYFKWDVEHVEDSGGYVRLKSGFSGQYLAADPNNSSNIKQYASPGDNGLWRFELLDDYAVKIICKASESSEEVLAVPLLNPFDGANLTQREYTDNSNCTDEWRLRGDKTINLAVIYDQAYLNRYTNANSRINDELSVLKEKYWNEFGITVNITLLSSFYSYADEYCSTDYDAVCNHASEDLCDDSDLFVSGNVELHDYHHTNVYNNMLRIPFPNISNEVKIAYWGHDYCTEHNHSGRSFNGLAYKSIGLAIITNFSSQTSETKTLIHEFGHFYGVIDHYGSSGLSTEQIKVQTGNNGYNKNCIYGENRENDDVLEEYIICDGCKSIIEDNKNLYNH